jgi:hypothetical protein
MKPGDKVILNEEHSQVRWFRKNRPHDGGAMDIAPGRVVTVKAVAVGAVTVIQLVEFGDRYFQDDLFSMAP